ncbi:MAG: 30S ribosomal protein S16 [Kiritimatiellae bacterium]|nr:30S ribosomal protein S16 [Kiritimatiellia bacterium]
MAVKIRLTRTGARNAAAFRVVAADSRSPRDGRFLEILGWYDPKLDDANCDLKLDRIEYWKSQGAEVSDTVKSLVKQKKAGREAVVEAPVAEEAAVEAPVAEAVVEEAAPEQAEQAEETEEAEAAPEAADEEEAKADA